MKVTDVRIKIVEEKEIKLKAVSSVTMDNEFVVHNVKIIEREDGLFIAFPSRRNPDGAFVDICHPINQETRNKIQTEVLNKYEEVLNSSEE